MDHILTQNITISCYDTDSRCYLKPASFMNMAQEVAQRHAAILGFGYDDLISKRTAWVLSRIHIKFLKYPAWRDDVTISTWHKGAEGLFYLRDFVMADKDKNPLIIATSSWLVLNIDTRHLSRETGVTDNGTSCDKNAIKESCGKIRIPSEAAPMKVGERHVSYSDVDMNDHANNVSYLVWAMDCLDYALTSQHSLKELTFNFNAEVHPNDIVELYRSDIGDKIYFEGKTASHSAFTLILEF